MNHWMLGLSLLLVVVSVIAGLVYNANSTPPLDDDALPGETRGEYKARLKRDLGVE